MFAPSRANSAGAVKGTVKCWPVRQVIAPRTKSPPTPNANFRTEGITMTHSALLSRSFGSPSGMSIISLNTWPQASKRFCSRLALLAKVGHARKMAKTRTPAFLMAQLLIGILDSFCRQGQITIALKGSLVLIRNVGRSGHREHRMVVGP